MGTIPLRLTTPSVGLIPTSAQLLDGETTDPSVSDPTAAAHKFAAAATPEPELDPDGFRSRAYGLRHCPPRPLHPLDECVDRKFAHSDRFALPRRTAPASRSRRATNASAAGIDPSSASEPAVVVIRSAVPMLSFKRIGTPWSGPRTRPARRSASRVSAIAIASGLTSRTDRNSGPRRSSASIRARYFAVSERALSAPDSIFFCRSAKVASSSSKGKAVGGEEDGDSALETPETDVSPETAASAPPAAPYRNRALRLMEIRSRTVRLIRKLLFARPISWPPTGR